MRKERQKIIKVDYRNENCPADILMKDFRSRAKNSKYSRNIEFSSSCVDFFKQMADRFEESEKNIKFQWDEIPEEELPPLIVKLRKKGEKYFLQFLKERGDETTLIQGKQRKGKNKYGKKIIIKKELGEDR